MSGKIELTLGPLLFNWPADRVRDFYAEVADRAPVDRVYLGEVVCGKRRPLLNAALAEAAERLAAAGKQVVWSSLALPATRPERRADQALVAGAEGLVEVNDISALAALGPDQAFVAGPLLNVYNEAAADELMRRGCVRLCANVELSLESLAAIHRACPSLEIELFAFGRLPLALSGRCYHARLHGLHKDACQFVCERDLDGLAVNTLEGQPFLAANGVQVLSHGVQLADFAPEALRDAGVDALRISPQAVDMVGVAEALRSFCDGRFDPIDLRAAVAAVGPPGELVNGYPRGLPGWMREADA